ncbi:hypothetical protein QFZ27_004669 [Inquilinus ginsengisoli]
MMRRMIEAEKSDDFCLQKRVQYVLRRAEIKARVERIRERFHG